MSFAAQLALWLHSVGELAGLPVVGKFALALVPLLALAQVFCWASVLTLNHLGHAIEESIRAVSIAGVAVWVSLSLVHFPGP